MRASSKKPVWDEKPVWHPLRKAVGEERCRQFMYMGKTPVGDFWIFKYKNILTRRYLNLDGLGNAYEYDYGEKVYRCIKLHKALNFVFS